MDYPVYGTLEWLKGLQAILVIAWLTLAGAAIADNLIAIRGRIWARLSKGYELCKLHSRPVGSCPPKSHDCRLHGAKCPPGSHE